MEHPELVSIIARSHGEAFNRENQIHPMVGHHCEYELLAFILAPTSPTSLRLRWSAKYDDQMTEYNF